MEKHNSRIFGLILALPAAGCIFIPCLMRFRSMILISTIKINKGTCKYSGSIKLSMSDNRSFL